jgi:hypothetical protein
VALVLLGLTAALVAWWPGEDERTGEGLARAPVPTVIEGAPGTWYCTARDAGVEGLAHVVLLTAVGDAPATAVLTAFTDTGVVGSSEVEVDPGATVAVDVAGLGVAAASVLVDSSGALGVEHRLAAGDGADQVPCASRSSGTWYFPTVVSTRGATARLTLFNPFPADAFVDVEVALDTGVRVPPALSGVVVPAGSSQVVELGESASRRDQFAVRATTRSGGVVAELAQAFAGSEEPVPVAALRVVPGSATTSTRWSFAGGLADGSARERLVLYNPTEDTASALVQLVPFGGTASLPEPFEVDIPSLRYTVVDLDKEGRVPQVGLHAIDVESLDRAGIVAARTLTVTGEADGGEANPFRSATSKGTSGGPGSPVAATDWLVTGLPDPSGQAVGVMVHNVRAGIAVVDVTAVSADGTAGEPVRVEVAEGDSTVVSAAQLGTVGGPWSVRVSSTSEVVVERFIAFGVEGSAADADDISLHSAVPVVADPADLEPLGG